MNDRDWLNEPKAVEGIWNDSVTAGFTMASDPLTCSLLRTLAASKASARFLEHGSGTGLSTAWILHGMDQSSSLITVDNDESLIEILRTHLGSDPRLEIVCADGDSFLQSQDGEHYDFIFADTWSGKYSLLDRALELVKPGGLYIIDDMLPQPNWPDGHAAKVESLINCLEADCRFHVTKISWASGIILAAKL
ncbi:class I SAM-dependent methyltransferase [Synechococcus sp. Lug-A]|uniref:O-methyltransferase n=1 Tax=Synechococcus sp. Lug-A TaxID=2823740 RepID=UPI0020CB87EC|nr:class I SAM-dependent methyltransferase [Synechococcus sp. Lug-A]MCP9845800.1 class I SAM-dependent methyltransferase [Synechococcus sp. Lug-A]